MVGIADDPAFPLRLAHVTYRSLVADPVRTVARMYDAFGLELSREAREAMAAKLRRRRMAATAPTVTVRRNSKIDPERERERASA
jgi:hypothetical protein